LKVDRLNWRLQEIRIEYDKDNWVQLNMNSWLYLTENISFSDFGAEAEEVIDLNE